ncbi:MAG: hypothetical protein ACP5O1_11130, partial [Phycisphaerae bacterium]
MLKPHLCVRGILCRSRRPTDPPDLGATPGRRRFCIAIATVAVIIFAILSRLTPNPATASVKTPPPNRIKTSPTPLSEFTTHCPLKFITGICTDGPHLIWVAGEDNGLYGGKITYHRPSTSNGQRSPGPRSDIISSRDLHCTPVVSCFFSKLGGCITQPVPSH